MAFSGAIGLLNLVPCFALDGQFILASCLLLIGKKNRSRNFVNDNEESKGHPFIYALIMLFGSILLALNMILGLYFLMISS